MGSDKVLIFFLSSFACNSMIIDFFFLHFMSVILDDVVQFELIVIL